MTQPPPARRGLTNLMRRSIVVAPMAGGPSTPELVIAAADAGALGFLAAGYKTPAAMIAEIAAVRAATDGPFGVNVFVPGTPCADPAALDRYLGTLRHAGPLGEAAWDDDGFDGKVAALLADPPPLASFTFGCPPAEMIRALQDAGTLVMVTVTSPGEAALADASGADALCVQGYEAGAHRGTFVNDDEPGRDYGLLSLICEVAAVTGLPQVAAGGIMSPRQVRAVIAAGAVAAQCGTAFLRCPESGAHPRHKAALADPRYTATTLTRAFSGRPARGLVNQFIRDHPDTPAAYPEVNNATRPLRAAAAAEGDTERMSLWAGQGYRSATEQPAGEIIERLRAGVITGCLRCRPDPPERWNPVPSKDGDTSFRLTWRRRTTMRNPRWGTAGLIAVILAAAALTVSACGSSASSSGAGGYYGGGYSTPTSSSSGGTMAQSTDLRTETTSAGPVLATSRGMTLYYYTKDKPGSGASSCTGGCASAWPPLTGTVQAPTGVTLPGPIGSITRSGGVHQVTINGYPLYTYAADKSPGQMTGNGIGGVWHVIKLHGAGSATRLLKAEVTPVGKVLANPHGMTVYYYAEDKPGRGTSACTGACARLWPPVIAPVQIPAGMTLPGPLGSITRPDGTRQLTINGYPIYRYAGDKAPGQASGNGIEGEWHVIKLTSSGSGGSGSGGSGSGSGGSGSGGGGYGY
jgi:nitronate monooxygenase